MTNKVRSFESIIGALCDYYDDNDHAKKFIADTFQTPVDLSVFAKQNNIELNYAAPNMELSTEELISVINEKLTHLRG